MRSERGTRLAVAVCLLAGAFWVSGASIVLAAPPAAGAQSTGSLTGTVTSTSGQPLPGAQVTVREVDSGTSTSLVTDASGTYTAPSLKPGTYEVRVQLQGFETWVRDGIALQGNDRLRMDAMLTALPDQTAKKPSMEIYGFAMLDIGHDFKQINPNWSDTLRVTRLPSSENEFGEDHNTFAGVRQSRLGVRTTVPTDLGDLKTTFEFELFGTGVDEGQTTFRLRHAYGELGAFGAGQYWSPFMDPDVFPNSLEYWGPTGMVFFRNVQVRWMPSLGEHDVVLAMERPGASGDQGVYADRVELQNIRARFPLPDVSGAYKYNRDWGYLRAAGMLRWIKWDDVLDDQFDLSGDATGWGINLSANYKPTERDVIRFQYVFGEGIQNYMNDSPVDIGIVNNLSDPVTPILGDPVPITGLVLFVDHTWSERFSSTFGYSRQDNDNREAQAPSAFRDGEYALGNILYYPVQNVMMGGELQWGRRANFSDGFESDGFKVQFSFKYNFSYKLGGQ